MARRIGSPMPITTEANESPAAPVPGRVLGIDPGLNVTGYAVVEPSPRGPFVVEAGIIRPRLTHGRHGPAAGVTSTRASRGAEAFPPGRWPSSRFTAMCATRARRS